MLKLQDIDECVAFFEDLCSPTELSAMEQRYEVMSLLLQDKVYLEILDKTSASTATISRVKRVMDYGTVYAADDRRDAERKKIKGRETAGSC
ncbi:MAG: YerC/YecD family TrpR-related protein [Lachnospiraceae bacterium]